MSDLGRGDSFPFSVRGWHRESTFPSSIVASLSSDGMESASNIRDRVEVDYNGRLWVKGSLGDSYARFPYPLLSLQS